MCLHAAAASDSAERGRHGGGGGGGRIWHQRQLLGKQYAASAAALQQPHDSLAHTQLHHSEAESLKPIPTLEAAVISQQTSARQGGQNCELNYLGCLQP